MMSTNKMPVLCKFGGNFISESNKVYYKGGTNRIVRIDRGIDYINLFSKVCGICKFTDISSIKYKYPGLDLDSLVSIENDDDVSNMMEAFTLSSEPIQLFVFCDKKISIPIANPSFLMQNADNGNDQASLRGLHESNGTLAPSSHITGVNNNDVPSASNDLHKMDCLLMDDQELPYVVVDSCVKDMQKMMSVLKEGQEFEDANAFHKALRDYAIRSKFECKQIRSGFGHYQAKCNTDDCSWRIHACKLPDKPTFKIKSLKGNHTCYATNQSNTRTHRQASRKWIATLVKDRLQKNLHCTPKDIVDKIRQEYGIKVSYDKAWRGKELALKEMTLEQYVPALRMLCEDIEMTNPGSTAKLSRSSNNSLRLFVAYKAAIYGFKQACRPLVMFDCWKMEGKCRGVWLFAMAFDAETEEFPISFAFVESKNLQSWKWFCDELAQVLECIPKLTFISNRGEGILEVVSGIFPYACHRYFQLGLIREICQKFNCRDLDQLFKSAVYAGVHFEFDACMREIHDKYKEAWNILKDINPKHWATSHFEEKLYFSQDYYSVAVNNFWYKMEGWRDRPISWVLVKLHDYMIEIFNQSLKKSSNWDTILVPRFEGDISGLSMSRECYSVSRGAAEFEFCCVFYANADSQKVDLEQRTCSCLKWQRFGYPCKHAIAAIQYSGCNVYDYFDVYFTVAKYRETYSEVINPLHLDNKSQNKGEKRKYVESDEVSLNDWLPSG